MSSRETPALLALAESIADGAPVDWEAAEAGASREEQPVIRQLRVLSSLAGLHRSIAADLAGAAAAPRHVSPAIGSWAHLRLIERLGGGAFGDVYRAWDEDLERDVALKLLRGDAAGESGTHASRIANEGRLLARVRHPNVVCVHGVAVHDDRVGLWMELLRGVTLEQQLAAQGPFSAREATLVGVDLCGALAAIHAAGLIHRDVKAQNVMREAGGRIVLMDLGTGREAGGRAVRAGPELAGTPLYLAPEIFRGSPASARTDLYSLGVLLYHLVTGSFPIRATTIEELEEAHAAGAVVRLRDARADLPPGFVRVIDRAISADPSARFETAGAFEAALVETLNEGPVASSAPSITAPQAAKPSARAARTWARAGLVAATIAAVIVIAFVGWPSLRRLGSRERGSSSAGVPAGAVRSIAVLPLANLSGDPAQEYFADGITDELISTLGRLGGVDVISRTSTMKFKGSGKTVPEIARALNVDAVLEGSVRLLDGPGKGARRVRVNARLIYAGSDTQLWDRAFEATASDVLALNDQVVKAIGDAIHARLSANQTPRPAQDFDAFDLYLRGRYYWNARTEEGLKRSVQYFQEAIDRRSDFALAYAGLADAYSLLGYYGFVPRPESRTRAGAAATRAVQLDDSLAEAHGSLAVLHYYQYELDDAEREYRRALELKPGYATAHQWYGYELAQRGRTAEAIAEMRRAIELDPLSVGVNGGYGAVLIYARQYDEAIAQLSKTAQMDPAFPRTHTELAKAYLMKGSRDRASDEARRAAALGVRDVLVHAHIAYVDAAAGRRGDAQRRLREILDRYSQNDSSAAMSAAIVYTALGDRDQAFLWLERARQISDPEVTGVKMDPFFDPLRGDPRLAKLLAAIGMPQ